MSNIEVGGPSGPGAVSSEGGLGDDEFSPASLAVSETIDQALKMIFAGEKSSSLASPMQLAATASKPPAPSVGDPSNPFGPSYFDTFTYDNEQPIPNSNPPKMGIFPSAGKDDGQTFSESLYFGMKYFMEQGNKDKFLKCLNTFQYLVSLGKSKSGGIDGLPTWKCSSGLGGSAPAGQDWGGGHSATDYDIKITSILIQAKNNGFISDADNPELTKSINDAITGLVNDDIDGGKWQDGNYDGHCEVGQCYAWDYIDPSAVNTIAQYCTNNNMASDATTLGQATNSFLTEEIDNFSTVDGANDQINSGKDSGGGYNGAGGTRLMMYLSNFILNSGSVDPSLQGALNSSKTLLQNFVTNAFGAGYLNIAPDGTFQVGQDWSGDSTGGAGIYGPMYLAMKALNSIQPTLTFKQHDGSTTQSVSELEKSFQGKFNSSISNPSWNGNCYCQCAVGMEAYYDINTKT